MIPAPEKRRTITIRPHAAWYNDSINAEKKKHRRLKRRWRSAGLSIDKELYVNQCTIVNQMISDVKFKHYSTIISENNM